MSEANIDVAGSEAETDSSLVLAEQTLAAGAWTEQAQMSGWLSSDDAQSIAAVSGATSSDLFLDTTSEPLVVALFGGTGVGKSSLLNRLVGEAVANVGVIRPTSLEATLYVHEGVEFAGPERTGFQRATHTDDARRHVVWVDMPDVDSTAAHNRELVLGFLPFVDVLIYVVSPERYRDESPWSLLRAHADKSAWVFVMNQIDRGQPAQLEDLALALDNAGFSQPVLYATSCGAPSELDQFDELAGFIDSLAGERIRDALHEEGRTARLRLLADEAQRVSASWPAEPQKFTALWGARKATLERELRTDLVERLAPVAARMAEGEAAAPGELWDEWASDRVGDALAATKLDAREAGWCAKATERLDTVIDADFSARCESSLRESVRATLARPGNAVQRAVYSACGWLVYALPLLAVSWISWFVVSGFYQGATGTGSFVAPGMAMNAVLLLMLAGGLPWLVGRLVEPSPRKAAMLGVRRGLAAVLVDVDERVQKQIDAGLVELSVLRAQRDSLVTSSAGVVATERDSEAAALTARLRRG